MPRRPFSMSVTGDFSVSLTKTPLSMPPSSVAKPTGSDDRAAECVFRSWCHHRTDRLDRIGHHLVHRCSLPGKGAGQPGSDLAVAVRELTTQRDPELAEHFAQVIVDRLRT